jgi:hypothetical protein
MNPNNSTSTATESSKQSPAHVFDTGRIRASIWEARANEVPLYKVTISCSYKRDNAWHRSHTFYAEELAAVVEVAARAQRWIERQKRQEQQQLAAA